MQHSHSGYEFLMITYKKRRKKESILNFFARVDNILTLKAINSDKNFFFFF